MPKKGSTAIFNGTSQSLSYTKNGYVYAYSSAVDADTAQVTLLDFNTGADFICASFYYSGYMGPDGASASAGLRGIGSIYFNNVRVYQIMVDTDSGNMVQTYIPKLMIPPHTHVIVKTNSTSDTADYVAQCAIKGIVV
tara:strand:+ start:76 stop:489 length:414 start_codon:yes stop_codon:yes gene_type:complete